MSTQRSMPSTFVMLAALLALGLALVVGLAACGSGPSQPGQTQPTATLGPAQGGALDGAQLLESRCSTSCHSADRAKQLKKTRDQWEQTVTRMIEHGAQLSDAEKAVLVDYLAKTYGP